MNTILEQYKDKIKGTFSFFDRIIIKGHIFQLFSLSGRKFFLSCLDVSPYLPYFFQTSQRTDGS